jgi:hypothetical protein
MLAMVKTGKLSGVLNCLIVASSDSGDSWFRLSVIRTSPSV